MSEVTDPWVSAPGMKCDPSDGLHDRYQPRADDADVYYFCGFACVLARMSYGSAEGDFRAAINRRRDNPDVYPPRGRARVAQRNGTRAEQDFTAALNRSKNDAKVSCERGFVRLGQGNDSGAEEDFTAGIGRGLDDANVYYARALARLVQQQDAAAEADLAANNFVDLYNVRSASVCSRTRNSPSCSAVLGERKIVP